MNSVLFKDVTKSFSNIKVLDNMNFAIPKGSLTCLLGPSGSGKTTMMKLMIGADIPTSGKIEINGKQLSHKELVDIGFMPQSDSVYLDLSGYDNLLFFGRLQGMNRVQLRNRILYLGTLLNMESSLERLVSTYSGGMKKRLSLMIALLHNPSFLILDEPTVGIDPLLRKKIWQEFRNLQSEGKTILISTHVLDEVQYCDRGILIREGKIIADDKMEKLLEISHNDIEELFLQQEDEK